VQPAVPDQDALGVDGDERPGGSRACPSRKIRSSASPRPNRGTKGDLLEGSPLQCLGDHLDLALDEVEVGGHDRLLVPRELDGVDPLRSGCAVYRARLMNEREIMLVREWKG